MNPSTATASLRSRLMASAIDALVLAPAAIVLTIGVIATTLDGHFALALALGILLFAAVTGYAIFFRVRTGATPAMRFAGLRAVDVRTAGPMSLGQALRRELPALAGIVAIVAAFEPGIVRGLDEANVRHLNSAIRNVLALWWVLDVATAIPTGRSLHDWFSGTAVVSDLRQGP